jgi:5-formyltetrahydrofolate cyclo-ligase
MHIAEEKSALRASIKVRMDRISKKDRDAEERSLLKRIKVLLGDEPKTIAAFVPLTDEVDIRPLLTDLLAAGWKLFLPRFEGGKLAFRKAEKITGLTPGQFGIPEPSLSSPLLHPEELDVILVPGRAFTKDGKRLGRGNGGYDIWIHSQRAANPNTKFVGIGLECQVIDAIPTEPHDEAVDMVLTARS